MTGHNPLTRDFQIRLDKLRKCAELVERSFVVEVEALEANLAKRAKDYPEHERSEFYEYHAEDYVELADELPTTLRYSVLTAADTALEVYLNDTCEAYAEVDGALIRVGDLHGGGITRARNYLKKVAKIPFPDETPEWIAVLRLHDLRNSIIHADGVVPESNTQVRTWSESIKGLHITFGDQISLARPFTAAALTAYESFGGQVDAACETLGLWAFIFPPDEF